jgi:KTSC domain-containing protein
MKMRPVNSSNVKKVGYDSERRVLRAEFRGGGTYDYSGVPPTAYSEMMDGRSIGSYLHNEVKPRFAQHKVEDAPQPVRDTGSAPIETAPDTLDEAIRRFNSPPEKP